MSEDKQVSVELLEISGHYRATTAGGNMAILYSPTSDGPVERTGVALCRRVLVLEAQLAAAQQPAEIRTGSTKLCERCLHVPCECPPLAPTASAHDVSKEHFEATQEAT